MLITAENDGFTAIISPHGEIDFDALPSLLAAARELPQSVTQVTWDLRDAVFMDIAGLHLLIHQRLDCLDTERMLTVTGLDRQPLRLLRLAQELFPAGKWGDFLPGGLLATAA
ncbi:STAS domain-containing protein [Streptomyces sp. NPDC059928]|uniref:STAS domain-containing protein n=1 Tax=unclassified Streptomyces TaxID=2593676 RepID=UPI00366185C4